MESALSANGPGGGRGRAEARAHRVGFLAACLPDKTGTLLGDKSVSVVFDNAKIKRFVPEFAPKVRFAEGIRRSIAWFEADPKRQEVDAATNATWDRLIAAYERGLAAAVREMKAG